MRYNEGGYQYLTNRHSIVHYTSFFIFDNSLKLHHELILSRRRNQCLISTVFFYTIWGSRMRIPCPLVQPLFVYLTVFVSSIALKFIYTMQETSHLRKNCRIVNMVK
jgi:hypothetical protein